jgi:polyadenylate-binding protein
MLVTLFDRNMVKSGKGNLCVKHLSPAVNNKELYDLFATHGSIFSSKVSMDIAGKSKGYGFVQYQNPEDAAKAIPALDKTKVKGLEMIVQEYLPIEKRPKGSKPLTNLYVKNLPPNVTSKEELKKLFDSYGVMTSFAICENTLNDKKGWCGYVNFEKTEDAAKALKEMNDKEIGGIKLFVLYHVSKEKLYIERRRQNIEAKARTRKFTLHVKTVANEPLSEEVVRNELSSYGLIKSVNIQSHEAPENQKVNSAVGFVVFEKEEGAEKVMESV